MRIHGETVTLWEKIKTGTDGFGADVFEETPVEVKNVLIQPGSSQDIVNNTNLNGKKVQYTLHIPKGDSHDWTDKRVTLRGVDFHTIGKAVYYTEDITPLDWNGQIQVEEYE